MRSCIIGILAALAVPLGGSATAPALAGPILADVDVRLIPALSPHGSDELPAGDAYLGAAGVRSVLRLDWMVTQNYVLEVWVSDVGSVNTGVTSVYLNVDWDNDAMNDAMGMTHTSLFNLFPEGTINNPINQVTNFGGSDGTFVGQGLQPTFARVGGIDYVLASDGVVNLDAVVGLGEIGVLNRTVSEVQITGATITAVSGGQESDFEYRCVVLESPSSTDQTSKLPESITQVNVGETFYVEFWASDVGDVNTGIVSTYADLDYPEGCVITGSITHSALFNLFPSGSDTGSMINELGGSQLAGNIGIEPEWARIAYVEFTASATCNPADFDLLPAASESSAYNRGLILPTDIGYGKCGVLIGALGACCYSDQTCTNDTEGGDCAASGGTYLGDGLTCDGDPDADGIMGCDDVCPYTPAPAGTDSEGRPLGDIDKDCDVDLMDHAIMQQNFSGPR